MRSRVLFPAACSVASMIVLVLSGCDDPADPRSADPSFELVDPAQRTAALNAHVYGSFAVAAGGGVIRSGPANFPGKPKSGPGTCVDGLWYNPQGKATSGSLAKPHPHCFLPGAAIEVVLEPITACYTGSQAAGAEEPPKEEEVPTKGEESPTEPVCPKLPAIKGATQTQLTLGQPSVGSLLVHAIDFADPAAADQTSGKGVVTGYAIDAATLGATNTRVGTLRFDLQQYFSATISYLHLLKQPGCDIDELIESPCLDRVITAVYNPLPREQGGIGPVDLSVEGFLWVTPASSAFNYTD